MRTLAIFFALAVVGCGDRETSFGETEGAATREVEPPLDFGKVILENTAGAPAKPPTAELTRAEALEDARFFQFFLKYAHAARAFLGTSAAYDDEAAFLRIKDTIASRPTWTVAEVFELFRPIVLDIPDAHLAVGVRGAHLSQYGGKHFEPYVFAAGEDAASADAGCELPRTVRLLRAQTFLGTAGTYERPVVLSRDAIDTVSCGGRTMKLVPLESSHRLLPNEFSERALDRDSYYVRLHTFAPWSTDVAQAFVASAAHAKDYKTVVLDLRGNGGGNPEFFLSWLKALGAKGTARLPRLNYVQSFAATVVMNDFLESALQNPSLEPDVRTRYANMLGPVKAQVHADVAAGDVLRFVAAPLDTPDAEVPLPGSFEGAVKVLVDERCASACDMASYVSEELPNFTVLGEINTMGATMSGEPMPIAMPNSGIVLNVPVAILGHPERRDVDGVGVAPRVWVEPATMRALYP